MRLEAATYKRTGKKAVSRDDSKKTERSDGDGVVENSKKKKTQKL
jgi:hypothetical protein